MDAARLTIVRKKSQVFQFILGAGFACAIGGHIAISAFGQLNTGTDREKDIMSLILGIALITFGLYFAYTFFKNSATITLDGDNLVFGKAQTYDLSKLQSAKLCCKAPAILNFPMEATVLIFEDGSTKTIFDDLYKDIWKLKSIVDQRMNHQEAQLLATTYNGNRTNDGEFKSIRWYKGNPVFSFRGITLCGFLLLITYVIFTDHTPGYVFEIWAAIYGVTLFVIGSWPFHYFGLSDQHLYIHNHHWYWIEKTYSIREIREIVIEQPYRRPLALRVILKNYQSKDYSAGPLTKTIWLELIEDLKLSGVKIRDEVYKTSKVV